MNRVHYRTAPRAAVVCFGMIVPAIVLVAEKFPEHNTGALITQVGEFISDDAAIVACLLRGWNVQSGLIGTALGSDARGKQTARRLKELGVLGKTRLSNSFATPYEVNISDRSGARTYFWQREPRVLATLDSADLSLLRGARMLYVDWYDGDHIIRPMQRAARLGVPVLLNLEHAHRFPRGLDYVRHATIVQANTNAAQRGGDAFAVARKLLNAGAETALITLADAGCLAATRDRVVRAYAPRVQVVDGCGAGATFSAGFLYGNLRGWNLQEAVKFAVAAASLKCTVVGPRAFPLRQIKRLAQQIRIV